VNRTEVVLTLKDGVKRAVGGYLVAPGLAIHRATPAGDGLGDLTNDWVVTHLPSGLRVGGSYRLRKDAERAGREFGDLTDWTVGAATAVPGFVRTKVDGIRNRILAESDGLAVSQTAITPTPEIAPAAQLKPIQETTPLGNEPVRAAHLLYSREVSELNQKFVQQFESSLVRTQIETLTDRIARGEDWLKDGGKLLTDLRAQLARVRYENELPAEVLGFINALVHLTTAYQLKIPGAYVRIVIPEVLTFEADLIYEDIPF